MTCKDKTKICWTCLWKCQLAPHVGNLLGPSFPFSLQVVTNICLKIHWTQFILVSRKPALEFQVIKMLIWHRYSSCLKDWPCIRFHSLNLKWLPTDRFWQKNACVTFTQAVLRKITQQWSAEGSSCCILSLCPVWALGVRLSRGSRDR